MNYQRSRVLEMVRALSPDGIPSGLSLAIHEWVQSEDPDYGWVVVPDLNCDYAGEVFRARLHDEQCDQGYFQIVVECSDSDSGDGFSEVGVWQAKIEWGCPGYITSISFGEAVSENPGTIHLWDCESEDHVKHDEAAIGRALMQWVVGQGRDSKIVKRMIEESKR